MKGIRIDASGIVTKFDGDAAALHDAVGGWIEAAPCERIDVTLWCNEDGKGIGLALNPVANLLWRMLGDRGCQAVGDFLVGPVVITGGTGPDGETLDLDVDALPLVLEVEEDSE